MHQHARQEGRNPGGDVRPQCRVEECREQQAHQRARQDAVDDGDHPRGREKDLPPAGAHGQVAHDACIVVVH